MTSDQQKSLAAESIPYAQRVAARYARKYPRFRDDLESAAVLGVLRATRTMDDSKSVWDFWLKRCIRWGIGQRLKELRRRGFHNREVSLRRDTPDIPTEGDQADVIDFDDFMEVGLKCLTGQQKVVIRSVYQEGLTVTEAGAVLGVTQSRASQIHHDALDKLSKFLDEQLAA